MRTYLFLLHSYPDIDHLAPMVWKCLEMGDRTLLLFDEPYEYKKDYRVEFLSNYPNCRILHLWGVESSSKVVRILSRGVWNYYAVKTMLTRQGVITCFFEWGEGVISHAQSGVLSEVKRMVARVRAKRTAGQLGGGAYFAALLKGLQAVLVKPLRVQLIRAARALNMPIFALPHGVSTKLRVDYNEKIEAMMNQGGGQLPHEDRNCFNAWVFSGEYERQLSIQYWGMDPQVAQTWGSLRFSAEWSAVLKDICPSASFPVKKPGQVRVLFFMPKWNNRVDKKATLELLHSLGRRQDLQVILKTHPRKGLSELEDRHRTDLLAFGNMYLAGDDHSVALIRGADVVFDVGSGMAIEALVQKKFFIYPAYLHQIRLIFDEYGGGLIAHSQSEVHQFLDGILNGILSHKDVGNTDEVLGHVLYGGRRPYDVPAFYYDQIGKFLSC